MLSTVRARAIAVTSAAVLSLTFVAAPAAVVAQDTPEEAVTEVFTAIEEWRFGDIVSLFCGAQADAAQALDFSSQFAGMPGDLGLEQLQSALSFMTTGLTVTVLEQDETTARVRIEAELSIDIDPDGIRAMMEANFESFGQTDLPEGVIDEAIAEMSTQIAGEAIQIVEEADMVVEDGAWKVCSPVGPGMDGLPDTDTDTDTDSEGDMDGDVDASSSAADDDA